MPQVVWAAGDKRSCLDLGECGGAGRVENDEIGAVGHDSAARQAEYAPTGAGAVFLEVVAEHRHQFRMDGNGAGFSLGVVLEFASLRTLPSSVQLEPLRG